jgi:hypothetical protein
VRKRRKKEGKQERKGRKERKKDRQTDRKTDRQRKIQRQNWTDKEIIENSHTNEEIQQTANKPTNKQTYLASVK